MTSTSGVCALLLPALLLLHPRQLLSQAADSAAAAGVAGAVTGAVARAEPPVRISGVLFGHFVFQPSAGEEGQAGQPDNGFLLERAYLTVRAALGPRTGLRVTTDLYQTAEATATAYALRAKYAYLQHALPMAGGGSVAARAGIVPNVLLESQDAFWPRYLSQAPTERAAYFSTADVGLAAIVTLPAELGEIHATVVNGSGYTSRERDRFKDVGLRLTLTPLASHAVAPVLQGLTLTVWGYKGAAASRFVNGGTGQVGAVGAALDRSRAGLFVAVRDARLTVAGEVALRRDGVEAGENRLDSPRVEGVTTGRLLSTYAIVRPLAYLNATGTSSLGLVARYDRVTPSLRREGLAAAADGADRHHVLIAGVFREIAPRAQVAVDYQESLPSPGATSSGGSRLRGFFAHFMVAW